MTKTLRTYALSAFLLLVGTAGFVSAQSSAARLGPIPEEATDDGKLKIELVPSYVVAYRRDGSLAGYIKREDLFDPKGNQKFQRIPVVDSVYLSRTVGFMVPNRGFVALGVRESDVPLFGDAAAPEADR
jgi:hypothetical protein